MLDWCLTPHLAIFQLHTNVYMYGHCWKIYNLKVRVFQKQPVLQRMQINFIFDDNVIYCVYHAISKSPKQLPNCLKIAATSVVLIVFNGVHL